MNRRTASSHEVGHTTASGWSVTVSTGIAIAGVLTAGLASMLLKSEILAQLLLTLALLAFLFAGAAACALKGAARAYCGAVCLVGLVYLVVSLHPWFMNVSSNLLTTRTLVAAWQLDADATASVSSYDLRNPPDASEALAEFASSYPAAILPSERPDRVRHHPSLARVMTAGQAAWAMLFALLAGWLSCKLFAWRVRQEAAR